MNRIRYLCEGCLVAPSCSKLCEKFTDKIVDVLFESPTEEELPILYNELKKHKRCILCGKNRIVITIDTYTNNTNNKTIRVNCDFCETMYIIKQNQSRDYLVDVYWEFQQVDLSSVFTFNKLFKDLGIKT